MKTHPAKQKIYIFAEKMLSLLTDKIICVSESEYNLAIAKGFNVNKLVLIHNGVTIKDRINDRNFNNKTHYKLLFVGRFDYQKGIDILANAITLLTEEKNHLSYQFTLIGEAVNSEDTLKFKESPQVQVSQLGWLKPEQLEAQYLSHDMVIIPSRWEGFAMVPLEAMSYGLPLLTSNIPVFHELENADLKHITFFDDHLMLYEHFKNLDSLPLEQNRENSQKIFLQKFSEINMKNKTYDIYNH